MHPTSTSHHRRNAKRRMIAARIDPVAIEALDHLVDRGLFVSRSHAIDAAIVMLLRHHQVWKEEADEKAAPR